MNEIPPFAFSMDSTGGHHIKWNKSDTERNLTCSHLLKLKKETN